jgi:hypothetical protein
MRLSMILAVLGLLGLAACGSPEGRLAQVSMTPPLAGHTPKAMETIGSAQPTPAQPM